MAQKLNCTLCDGCRKIITGKVLYRKGKKRVLEYCSEACVSANAPKLKVTQ